MAAAPEALHSSKRLPGSQIKRGVACPMANEGDNAARFTRAVLEQCPGLEAFTFLVIVDKASTDDTRKSLEALAQAHPAVVVVWTPENRTVVDAHVRGYREAIRRQAD